MAPRASALSGTGRYGIEARSLPLLRGLACHDFWVLRGPDGHALAELHGLATDRISGRAVPIGTDARRHALRVWHVLQDGVQWPLPDCACPPTRERPSLIRPGQPCRVMLQGSHNTVLERWLRALAVVPELNALDLDYPNYGVRLFGATVNSNSCFRTLGEQMQLEIPRLSWSLRPGARQRMLYGGQPPD